MKKLAIIMVCILSLGFAACGTDNVAACKDLVTKLTDCSAAVKTAFPDSYCDNYESTDCDVSD